MERKTNSFIITVSNIENVKNSEKILENCNTIELIKHQKNDNKEPFSR